MKATDLRKGLEVRPIRTIKLDGNNVVIVVPRGRPLTVQRVESGYAIVGFQGREIRLNPKDLEIAP